MISHSHRCIFVHIPKTAGNSVNRVFGVDWQNHKDLARYHAEVTPEVFASYFKFAIVRNPWDRLFSDYNYQLKKSRPADSKLFIFADNGGKRSFAAWVETALAESSQYAADRWGGEVSPHIHRWSPQVDWLEVDGRVGVDFVARMEHLSRDFPEICDRLNLPDVRLPHRNRRLHWHYSHYYDRATRAVVADYYARDIAAFGYEFEDSALRLFFAWRFAGQDAAALPASAEPAPAPKRKVRRIPPPRARIRRAALALAAGVALLLGAWGSSALRGPNSPESLGRRLFTQVARAAIPLIPNDHPLSEVLRLAQLSPDVQLSFTPVPIAGLSIMPILVAEDDDDIPNPSLLTKRVAAFPAGGPDPRVFRRPTRALATTFFGR